jgi:hypothetical protein
MRMLGKGARPDLSMEWAAYLLHGSIISKYFNSSLRRMTKVPEEENTKIKAGQASTLDHTRLFVETCSDGGSSNRCH